MGSDELTYAGIEKRLLEILPEFEAAHQEWLTRYDSGLPHCVFGTLTQYVIDEYRKGSVGPGTPFDRALRFLEEAMGAKDIEVQNLVWVSFLENLHIAGKDFEAIKARLGPRLRATLKKIV